jgi:hypothetical protein
MSGAKAMTTPHRYFVLIAVITITVIIAVFAGGCGGSDDCIVLANGGNKLCGQNAAAWCDSTDTLRDTRGISQYLTQAQRDAVAESQMTCDEIRSSQ